VLVSFRRIVARSEEGQRHPLTELLCDGRECGPYLCVCVSVLLSISMRMAWRDVGSPPFLCDRHALRSFFALIAASLWHLYSVSMAFGLAPGCLFSLYLFPRPSLLSVVQEACSLRSMIVHRKRRIGRGLCCWSCTADIELQGELAFKFGCSESFSAVV
jgi:hypothetical protein